MPDSLLIGLSALQVQKRAMEVTSHNLANATTPGFSRQNVEMSATLPEDSAPGQLGRGVDLIAIRRVIDLLSNERLRASASETSRLKTLNDNLKTVELVFNEPGETGLSGVTNNLFNTFSDLSNNPESAALRSTTVQQMQTWASTLNDLSSHLDSLRQDLHATVTDQISNVNQLTSQIAKLNQQIRNQTLVGNNPNDLLDTRDKLVNELSGYLNVRARLNPADGSVLLDSSGVQLVSLGGSNDLNATITASGSIHIVTPNGSIVSPSGGSLSALDELNKTIIPNIMAAMDDIAATTLKRLNALQATGTSQAMSASSFLSSFTIPSTDLTTDLDDTALEQTATDGLGIPATFLPSFTDSAGNLTARNLTINVRDTTTDEARKYTVRFDPAGGSGTRSLQDLVTAINTGTGGGFTVIPSDGIGIPNLNAKAVPVTDGYKLQLTANTGYTIDFSPALDLKPASRQWAGAQISVASSVAIPASVGTQLQFQVEPVTTGTTTPLQLRVSARNPTDGSRINYGTVPLSAAGVTAVSSIGGTGAVNVTVAAGSYHIGDTFVVDLNSGGAVLQKGSSAAGPYVQTTERTLTDAGFTVTGRYSGSLSLSDNASGTPPYNTWSMRVVSSGTIGATTSTVLTDPQPPVVEFSYWTGVNGSPTLQTVQRTLDNTLPPGAPVQIADGVYAVFDVGDLTNLVGGTNASFTVDAEPDQAGLLPALGVNGMFTGSSAASIAVSANLINDPTQLNVGLTRSEGDNSNILRFIGTRKEKLFSDGTLALDDRYNSVLSDVGSQIQQASRLSENQTTIQAALENQRQQVSGVNIDEEVGNMILQQQAYSAAAQVVNFSRQNIQTLLSILQ